MLQKFAICRSASFSVCVSYANYDLTYNWKYTMVMSSMLNNLPIQVKEQMVSDGEMF